MYSANNSANGEPFWLHQSFPKHHYNELLQGKLPKATLSTNEYINFQNSPPKVTHLSGNWQLKLAQHCPRITLEHLQESALRVITTHQNAQDMPRSYQESPGSSGQDALKI